MNTALAQLTFNYQTLLTAFAAVGAVTVVVLIYLGARAIGQHFENGHSNRGRTIADDYVEEIDVGGN